MTKKTTDGTATKAPPRAAKEEAGFVPVTIKFPVDLHRRLKVRSLDYRGRKMGALAHACITYVLDEIDAGRTPEAVTDSMNQMAGGDE